jgi:hypothetical protein
LEVGLLDVGEDRVFLEGGGAGGGCGGGLRDGSEEGVGRTGAVGGGGGGGVEGGGCWCHFFKYIFI